MSCRQIWTKIPTNINPLACATHRTARERTTHPFVESLFEESTDDGINYFQHALELSLHSGRLGKYLRGKCWI